MNLLFLDLGGVLVPMDCQGDLASRWGMAAALNPAATQMLREYLEQNDVEVVVISALRAYDGVLAAVDKALGVRTERLPSGEKAVQISEYLRKQARRGWRGQYAILDDEPVEGHERQQVLVHKLLTAEDVQKVQNLLGE